MNVIVLYNKHSNAILYDKLFNIFYKFLPYLKRLIHIFFHDNIQKKYNSTKILS